MKIEIMSNKKCESKVEEPFKLDYHSQFIIIVLGVGFTTTSITIIAKWRHRVSQETELRISRLRREGCCYNRSHFYAQLDLTSQQNQLVDDEIEKDEISCDEDNYRKVRKNGIVPTFTTEKPKQKDYEDIHFNYTQKTAVSSRQERALTKNSVITVEENRNSTERDGTYFKSGYIYVYGCDICTMFSCIGNRLVYHVFRKK